MEGSCEQEERIVKTPTAWLVTEPTLRQLLHHVDAAAKTTALHVHIVAVEQAKSAFYVHFVSIVAICIAALTTMAALLVGYAATTDTNSS